MKRVCAAAYATVLSMAFAGSALASQTGEALSDSQLDAVVAGGSYDGKTSSCSTCGGLLSLNNVGNVSKVANGNKILSGNDVNILNGNNTAVGVGILGTGAIAFKK
jgi:hypothetical protein